MTQQEIISLFEQNKSLIYNRAEYYSKKMRTDKEELMSEGKIAFFKAAKTHKFNKFSTYLWYQVSQAMLNYASQNYKQVCNSMDEEYGYAAKEEIEYCIEENFSPKAAEIVRLIIDNEITHLADLTKILVEKGYKQYPYIQAIYREIRSVINEGKRRKK